MQQQIRMMVVVFIHQQVQQQLQLVIAVIPGMILHILKVEHILILAVEQVIIILLILMQILLHKLYNN